MRALIVAAVVASGVGCVSVRAPLRCRDDAPPRCLTPVACEWDARRGCEVCRCSDAPYAPLRR